MANHNWNLNIYRTSPWDSFFLKMEHGILKVKSTFQSINQSSWACNFKSEFDFDLEREKSDLGHVCLLLISSTSGRAKNKIKFYRSNKLPALNEHKRLWIMNIFTCGSLTKSICNFETFCYSVNWSEFTRSIAKMFQTWLQHHNYQQFYHMLWLKG